MIIWGTRGLTSTTSTAQFHCPQCSQPSYGHVKQVRNFFTLYFIPIIPMNVAGRYVECSSCGGTFAEEILSYDPEKERREGEQQMLRVMVMAALADGVVDAAERAEIEKQYQVISGLPIPAATLDQEIMMAQSSNANLNTFVAAFANSLSPHGKAMIVQLAFDTMSASGDLQPGHQQQLSTLAETLAIPQDQFMELIQQLSEPDPDPDGEATL